MASSHDAFLEHFGDRGASASQLAVSYAMAENTFAVTSGGFGAPPAVESVDTERFAREHRAEQVAPGAPGSRAQVSSGRVLPEHHLVIVGPGGEELPERAVGEIALRSPCLMSGYDHNVDATAEAIRDGRYFTGDLGYLAAGELFVTGRVRDLIIVGGRNIYPQDIEQVVERVDGVVAGRVVAVGIPNPRLGTESLAVLAETKETDQARRSELQRAIHSAIAERTEVVPQVVRVLDHRSLLKSSSGKPARGANRERFLSDPDAAPHHTPPAAKQATADATATARRVVEEVLANLGDEGGPLDDRTPLLTSGRIDSLGMVELFAGLEMACNCSISDELRAEAERFDTLDAIARTITALGGASVVEAAPPRTRVAPLAPESIPMRYGRHATPRPARGFWTRYYQALLRAKGIRCGPGLKVLGPLLLQIEGRPKNIHIGADVTLMPERISRTARTARSSSTRRQAGHDRSAGGRQRRAPRAGRKRGDRDGRRSSTPGATSCSAAAA